MADRFFNTLFTSFGPDSKMVTFKMKREVLFSLYAKKWAKSQYTQYEQ